MHVELDRIAKGPSARVVSSVRASLRTGHATNVACPTEQGPSVLALMASGRMKPDSGDITIDDEGRHAEGWLARRRLRGLMAIVDAPSVCAPDDEVRLGGVIAEELGLAGYSSWPPSVARFLESLGLEEYAGEPMRALPPLVRVRALTEAALLRPGVRGVVITTPDRHGGATAEWWAYAKEVAARGLVVLTVSGEQAEREIERLESSPAEPAEAPASAASQENRE